MFVERVDDKKLRIVTKSGESFPISQTVYEKIGDLSEFLAQENVPEYMEKRAKKLEQVINRFEYYQGIWDFLQENEYDVEATEDNYQKYDELVDKLQETDQFVDKGTTIASYQGDLHDAKLLNMSDESITSGLTQGLTLAPHTMLVDNVYRYTGNGRDDCFYVSGSSTPVESELRGVNVNTVDAAKNNIYQFGDLSHNDNNGFDFSPIFDRTFRYKYSDIGQLVYLTKYGIKDLELKNEYQQDINAIMYSVINDQFESACTAMNIVSPVTIVPFPSNSTEYNHVMDVSVKLAAAHEMSYADIFQKNTKQKGKYLDIDQTYEANAFSLKEDVVIPETDILLIDDLYGTGKTLRELLKVLRDRDFKYNVYFLAMSRIEGAGFGGKNNKENSNV